MKNVYIYCEGQTEESFINEVLSPHFYNIDKIIGLKGNYITVYYRKRKGEVWN